MWTGTRGAPTGICIQSNLGASTRAPTRGAPTGIWRAWLGVGLPALDHAGYEARGGGGKSGRSGSSRSYYGHTRCGGRFRGGVAGAEPPHKGGPTRPDRPELQWSVVSGQWSVVSGQWSVVSGQWSVVSGQWSVVSGQFSEPAISMPRRKSRTGRCFVAARDTRVFTPILGCTLLFGYVAFSVGGRYI